MRILYVTLVDISQPTGPGTNELEAIIALEKCKKTSDKFVYIIPKPKNGLNNIKGDFKYFSAKNKVYKGFSLIGWQLHYLKQFTVIYNNVLKSSIPFKVIIRPDKTGKLFLLPIWLWVKKIPYGLRHVQDQYNFSAKKSIKTKYKNFLLKIGIRHAKYLDTTLPERAKAYSVLSGKNVHVIHNAVNLDRFNILNKPELKRKLGISPDKFVIGYIGGVPLDRGATELLNTASSLVKSIPELHILIVGDSKHESNSHLSRMRQIVREFGIESMVTLTGVIPFQKIVSYFNALDVGVALVPKKEVLEKGNSSQKIYQYLACGVPVIIPNGTHTELVESNAAFEVEPGNYDDFAKKLISLKKNMPSKEVLRLKSYDFSVEKRANNQLSEWKAAIK